MSGIDLEARDVFGVLATLASTACVGLWRAVASRATKAELAKVVDDFKQQNAAALQLLADHRRESKESAERIYDKIDQTIAAVGDLAKDVGRLEGAAKK